MYLLQKEQFNQRLEETYSLLARQKNDLDEYKRKPKASIKAVEYRTEILMRLLNFVQLAETVITDLSVQVENEYKRGWKAGLERGRKENKPNKYFDKEQARGHHNISQYQKWADHY